MSAEGWGFQPDTVIQELGWDDDVDDALRADIEKTTGNAIVDGDAKVVVDGVVLWWRADDGDVADGLMDALTDLAEGGQIWLMTPKVGRTGHVPNADIAEGAQVAGLATTSTLNAGADWVATRMATPKR